MSCALLFRIYIALFLYLQGRIARLCHGELDIGYTHFFRIERDGGAVSRDAHARLLHPVEPANCPFDRTRAGRAGHPVDRQDNLLYILTGLFLFAHNL